MESTSVRADRPLQEERASLEEEMTGDAAPAEGPFAYGVHIVVDSRDPEAHIIRSVN